MDVAEYPAGKSRRIQLAGAGDRHSTVWGVFSARHAADLYICPRMMGGAVKVSLHQSGSWQAGVTAEHAARRCVVGARHWDVWQRGAELAPGIVRAWYLLLPDQELRDAAPDGKAHQIPPVGTGHAASVEFLMMSDEGPTVEFENVHVVGRWRLVGRSESCFVVARRIPWTNELEGWADEARVQAMAQAKAAGVFPEPHHRYYFHGYDAQGVRFGLELAPPPEAV